MTPSSARGTGRGKRWWKRIAIGAVLLGSAGFGGHGWWMSAHAADIEYAVLSGLRKDDRTYSVSSPTGPRDELLERLRSVGISAVRMTESHGIGITLSILPTGMTTAIVRYEMHEGPLTGGGWNLFMHKVDGKWIVEREEMVYQV